MALAHASWYAAPVDHHSGSTRANILHRAGRSRWWDNSRVVPLVNLIGLWVLRSPDGRTAPQQLPACSCTVEVAAPMPMPLRGPKATHPQVRFAGSRAR